MPKLAVECVPCGEDGKPVSAQKEAGTMAIALLGSELAGDVRMKRPTTPRTNNIRAGQMRDF